MAGARGVSDPATARTRLLLGLVLAVPLPVAALAVALYASARAAESSTAPGPLTILLALGGLAAAAGGVVLWQAARRLPAPGRGPAATSDRDPAAVADTVAAPSPDLPMDAGTEDADAMMDAFSRMLSTVERQASEIESFARRLDSAYKQIESSSAQLKEFSFKDEVTGLYNRRFFSIRLEEEVSRYRRFNHPVSVVLLDLDQFKLINDELGHPAGDETLRGMADILLKHSRGINVICRYGGDEFAVLLVETSKGGARLYADRIRYVLPTYNFSHGRHVTASFGIASLPEDVTPSADALIQAADEALYAAKRAGKNRVCVYEDIRAPMSGGAPPAGRP
jgi:diguanylate cyclase (GGDEF)-like protein